MDPGRQQDQLGIYYTPPKEVDFMCRRALVEYLCQYMPSNTPKQQLFDFVFNPLPENQEISPEGPEKQLWGFLEKALKTLTVVDPACGTGAFLLGMLNVLMALNKAILMHQHKQTPDAVLKAQILQNTLYGVDVRAETIQELEVNFHQFIRDTSAPNLNLHFNLRVADALVQDWTTIFPNIFAEKGGFDIVIGNPPYVRQELIAPPFRIGEIVSLEEKQKYKLSLKQAVQRHFPVVSKLDNKSDYYIYFFFIGLRLLNAQGTLCFITSNTWLDVGYGKYLQEFLLKYVPILAFYDTPQRSFTEAGINTVISLFGAPQTAPVDPTINVNQEPRQWPMLGHICRFVTFKKSLEDVPLSRSLADIENVPYVDRGAKLQTFFKNVADAPAYRLFPIKQGSILENRWEYPEPNNPQQDPFLQGSFRGDSWGSKYLRAPSIFYTILEKGEGKFVELSEIAKIRRGFTTGANAFFFLNHEARQKWNIEDKFLQPVLKSPKEHATITISDREMHTGIFLCNQEKAQLGGTQALKYIEWGETQRKENGILWSSATTTMTRGLWYAIEGNTPVDLLLPRAVDHRYICYYGSVNYSDRFYGITTPHKQSLCLFLNSAVFMLFAESLAKQGLGYGALDLNIRELKRIPILLPPITADFEKISQFMPKTVFEDMGIDLTRPASEQVPHPSPLRRLIDDTIFNALSLSKEERNEVYKGVCELIYSRKQRALI